MRLTKDLLNFFFWQYCLAFFLSPNHFDIVLFALGLSLFLGLSPNPNIFIKFKTQKEIFFKNFLYPYIDTVKLVSENLVDFLDPYIRKGLKGFFILVLITVIQIIIFIGVCLIKLYLFITPLVIKRYNLFKSELSLLKKQNIIFNNIFGIFIYYPHYESKKSIFVRFSAVFVLILSFLFVSYIFFFMDFYFSEDDRSIFFLLLNIFSIFLFFLISFHIYYSLLHLYNHNSINDVIINPFNQTKKYVVKFTVLLYNIIIFIKDKIIILYNNIIVKKKR